MSVAGFHAAAAPDEKNSSRPVHTATGFAFATIGLSAIGVQRLARYEAPSDRSPNPVVPTPPDTTTRSPAINAANPIRGSRSFAESDDHPRTSNVGSAAVGGRVDVVVAGVVVVVTSGTDVPLVKSSVSGGAP